MRPDRPVVGWKEWVGLPELGVKALRAKVDTGARTSSLHAEQVDVLGRRRVSFRLPPGRRGRRALDVEAPLLGHRLVRDSGGRETLRPVVSAMVVLGTVAWPVEVTLADRAPMGHRMLLGRQAVRRRFLVDPSRAYVQGRPQPTAPAGPAVFGLDGPHPAL